MNPHGYFTNKRRKRPMFRQQGRFMAHGRIIVLSAIGAVALALLPIALPRQTTWLWNATASTPIGFYHLQPIRRLYDGELVAAMPPRPIAAYLAQGGFLPLGVPLLKHIAALPGQTICRHGDVITIDGKQAAIALNDDHLGRPLPRWSGCQKVHQGQVFLMNSNVWDSLDGRYFGPFPTTTIIGHAIPSYIQRDGTSRDGERGQLYGATQDRADGDAFLGRAKEDRHQFRFIVSPEDTTELGDLNSFTRDLMHQVEADLGTQLDWVAVNHFNTGHPHVHIIVNGHDELGEDLVINGDYIAQGIRERASERVTLELGPVTELEQQRKLTTEIGQDRFTRIDRALIDEAGRDDPGYVQRNRATGQRQIRAGGKCP